MSSKERDLLTKKQQERELERLRALTAVYQDQERQLIDRYRAALKVKQEAKPAILVKNQRETSSKRATKSKNNKNIKMTK